MVSSSYIFLIAYILSNSFLNKSYNMAVYLTITYFSLHVFKYQVYSKCFAKLYNNL